VVGRLLFELDFVSCAGCSHIALNMRTDPEVGRTRDSDGLAWAFCVGLGAGEATTCVHNLTLACCGFGVGWGCDV